MKNLIEALMDLDPENPNHWTADGLPKVDALRFSTGNPGLTREDITNAAPLFTRDNRVVEEPEAPEPVRSADPELKEAIIKEGEITNAKVISTLEVKVTLTEALRNLLEPEKVGDVTGLSDAELKDKLERLSNVVKEINDSCTALTEMVQAVQADMDKLILEQDARRPKTKMTATQMYLQAQKERTPEDMLKDHMYLNPVDDPIARMISRRR